jgi:hypothetical protein
MSKQASAITIAKQKDGYSLKATGAFGGGFTRHVSENELVGGIIRAWQMYGNNPLGCSVIGDIPQSAQDIVDKLTHPAESDTSAVLTVRLSGVEADLIRTAAESAGKSINQWCRQTLLDAIRRMEEYTRNNQIDEEM